MTQRVLVVLLIGGCNQILGLVETAHIDAQAVIDTVPPVCPSLGTIPEFHGPITRLEAATDCQTYTVSRDAGIAIALCAGAGVSEGIVDATLAPATMVPASTGYAEPRISPEGDILTVLEERTIKIFNRGGDRTWTLASTGFVSTQFPTASVTSRSPRRMMVRDWNTTGGGGQWVVRELSDGGLAPWPVLATYGSADLGTNAMNFTTGLFLSEDGLRLLFVGSLADSTSGILYSDRETLAERFRPARVLASLPQGARDPFMTHDCGRLYYSLLGTIFYIAQN